MKTTQEYEDFARAYHDENSKKGRFLVNSSDLLKAWDEYQATQATQPDKEELIPFNLEEALREPERVRTRSGNKVVWSYFEVNKEFPIVYFTDAIDAFMSVATNGLALGNKENTHDLMLVKKKQVVWFGLYENLDGVLNTTGVYNDKDLTKRYCEANKLKLLKLYSYEL